eukprot:7293118-Pyramimonas_sp.AAC.1
MCSRDTYVYASLDDIWNALAHALGDYQSPQCARPSLKGILRAGADVGRFDTGGMHFVNGSFE